MPSDSSLPTSDLPATVVASSDTVVAEVTAPAGYELLGLLGRGGMGVVWRARDLRLGREVALKFLLSGDPARLRAEAETLARLQHPHIVQVFEVGEHQGRPYLALELCSGGSLEERLAQKPLPPRAAAELVRTLAEAMQAAHAARVIHRDLKPGNVLLAPLPRIADFGLARQLDDVGQTATGAILGTPSYMAPEQAQGQKDLTPAVDIYALGAILYATLTGRPPFRAATTMDTLWQVLHSEPVPPRTLNPAVPRDLETICLKCLGKVPSQRYASAQALADDLGRYLEGRPIAARPVGLVERGYRWVQRNPVVASLAAAVSAVLVAGVVVASLYALRAAHEADEARKARREAESELLRSRWNRYGATLLQAHRSWAAGEVKEAAVLLDGADWDLRGPEYRFLHDLFHRVGRRSFAPAGGKILHAAWSPDGTRVVTADHDSVARILDVVSGRELVRLPSGVGHCDWAEFRPDGRAVATANTNGVVKVFDAATGREERAWRVGEATGDLLAVRWSPDGGRLLVLGERHAYVWDADTGAELLALDDRRIHLWAAAWSPDGKWLALAGGVGIRLHDAVTGREVPGWEGRRNLHGPLAWSPDGKYLAAEIEREGVRLFEVATGKALPGVISGRCRGLAWSPDGQYLALTRDKSIEVVERDSDRLVRAYPGATSAGRPGISWSPDGRTLLACVGDTATLWDFLTGTAPAALATDAHEVARLAWSPDGALFVCARNDRHLRVFEGRTLRELAALDLKTPLRDVAFHPRGTHLACARAGPGDGVVLHDLATGVQQTLAVEDAEAVAWSPDGRRLAVASGGHTVRVFDAAHGAEERRLEGHRDAVHAVAWSPDGRWLASAGLDRVVRLWDAATGNAGAVLKGHTGDVLHLAWNADGDRLASASLDGSARVWDVRTKREILSLRPGERVVASVAWSRDGQLLLTGGEVDLHIWKVVTGQMLVRLAYERDTQSAVIRSAVFDPDERRIAFADAGGRLRVWPWGGAEESPRVLWGTGAPLTGVAFTRPGVRLAAQDDNGAVLVWDARTGQPLPRADEPDDLPKVSEARDQATGIRAVIEGTGLRVYPAAGAGEQEPPRDLFQRNSPRLWHRDQARQWAKDKQSFAEAFHLERLLECDPFDAAARGQLEALLKALPDRPDTIALRQRWAAFQASRAAAWLALPLP